MIGPARRPERACPGDRASACPGDRASACPVLRNTCPGTTHPRWIWASGCQSCPRPRPLTSARERARAGPRPPCDMTSVSPLKPLSALVPEAWRRAGVLPSCGQRPHYLPGLPALRARACAAGSSGVRPGAAARGGSPQAPSGGRLRLHLRTPVFKLPGSGAHSFFGPEVEFWISVETMMLNLTLPGALYPRTAMKHSSGTSIVFLALTFLFHFIHSLSRSLTFNKYYVPGTVLGLKPSYAPASAQ